VGEIEEEIEEEIKEEIEEEKEEEKGASLDRFRTCLCRG